MTTLERLAQLNRKAAIQDLIKAESARCHNEHVLTDTTPDDRPLDEWSRGHRYRLPTNGRRVPPRRPEW